MKRILFCLALLPLPLHAQPQDELSIVRKVFEQVQPLSTKQNREYCGYIGFDESGTLTSTKAKKGRTHECRPRVPRGFEPVASWHTHAGFDLDAYSEVPSVMDFEADEEEGVDGYVATPGGRLWYIDTTDGIISQVCGLGCLYQDPEFRKGAEGEIRPSYTYQELLQREAETE